MSTRKEYKNKLKYLDRGEYNCGGYAFEDFEWGNFNLPFFLPNSMSFELPKMVDAILSTYEEQVRLIHSVDEVDWKNEYLILMRVGDDDFHFVKKTHKHSGYWHKRGRSSLISRMPKKEVFSDSWLDGCYDSNIVYLAKLKTREFKEEVNIYDVHKTILCRGNF